MSNTHCCISHPRLTFSHRSGVTPYTSSCELAGSCVFGKQLPERLSLRLLARSARTNDSRQTTHDKKKYFMSLVISHRSSVLVLRTRSRPYPEVTAAFLPSSLTMNHSFPLGYSPYPPVSVYGTDSMLRTLEVFLENVLSIIVTGKPATLLYARIYN